jgi:DNA polymerase III sliding clamp (beta) subunit (PCNA family)
MTPTLLYKLLVDSVSKEEHRDTLQNVYVKNGMAYATDGFRLMALKVSDKLLNGPVIVNDKEETITPIVKDVEYPDITQVIPRDLTGYTSTEVVIPKIKVTGKQLTRAGFMKNGSVNMGSHPDVLVYCNLRYIEKLAGETVTVWTKDKTSPIIIDYNNSFADKVWFYIIMPVKGE